MSFTDIMVINLRKTATGLRKELGKKKKKGGSLKELKMGEEEMCLEFGYLRRKNQ